MGSKFSYFFLNNSFVNPRAHNQKANGGAGFGTAGCEGAIRFAEFCKMQRIKLSFLVLMCSNSNDLNKYIRRASKFIPRDRIFACHVSMRRGGNGKSIAEAINNFPNWRHAIEKIIPDFVASNNHHGGYNLVEFTTSGGTGTPALVYFNYLIDKLNLFEHKLIILFESLDEFSQENQDEIISELQKQNRGKIVFAQKATGADQREVVDFGIGGIIGGVACVPYKWDTSDYMIRLPKYCTLSVAVGAIPYYSYMIFFRQQHHENTRDTLVNMYRTVGINQADWVLTVGDVSPNLVNVASEIVLPAGAPKAKHDMRVAGIHIGKWNTVVGRFRGEGRKIGDTPHFDFLRSMFPKDEETE